MLDLRCDLRPLVGVSSCLPGGEVRYDGGHKWDDWITGPLARRVTLVPVCPEVGLLRIKEVDPARSFDLLEEALRRLKP